MKVFLQTLRHPSQQWKALAGAAGGLAIAVIDYYTGGGTVSTIEQAVQVLGEEVGTIVTNMFVGWALVYFSPGNK